jgi:iron complex outermembrane receptor protein
VIRTIRTFAVAAWCACAFAGNARVAAAQTTAELVGIVRDPTGAVVPAVTVTLSGKTLPAPVAIETDQQGKFVIRLSPGTYRVSAAARFLRWSGDVEVSASGSALDILLILVALEDTATVTATRTGTADIQSTPIAITALSARTLEQTGVERVEHLVGLVPTLMISQSPAGTPIPTLRGIGSNGSTMQLDGVHLAGSTMRAIDLFDVERVEVLRGPQGTLVGRNAIGGTIHVITRQPTNALAARARLTFGNYAKIRAEGGVSGPLVGNRIMGGFAFVRESGDGFVTDVDHPDHSLGSEDTWGGRGQLRFVFGLRSELLLSGDYLRARGTPLGLVRPLARNPDAPPSAPSFKIPDDFWAVRASHLADGRNDQGGAAARLSVQVADSLTLTSLTAYRNTDLRVFSDSDTTENEVATARVPDRQLWISQELTLTGRTARLTWISGVSAFDAQNRGGIDLTLYRPPMSQLIRTRSTIDASAWAVFGQAGYRLSERISLTGGLRYSDEQEHATIKNGSAPINFDSTSDHAWTPQASIELRAARNTFVYVSATRGYKSGGVNITDPDNPFRPEFAWSYETGVKRTFAGGGSRVNAALFYIDYTNLQVSSFASPGVIVVSNTGHATSKGLEIEGATTLGRSLQFVGMFSWLDAAYGRYALGGEDASGNRLRNAPEWSGSASAIYEMQTARGGRLTTRGDVAWQSRVFFTPLEDAIHSQPAFSLVHLRTAFEPRSRRWELAVYLRNVGRQEYVTTTWDATGGLAISGRPGEPRHWGTQFTIRH